MMDETKTVAVIAKMSKVLVNVVYEVDGWMKMGCRDDDEIVDGDGRDGGGGGGGGGGGDMSDGE
jgi:hypothetical protein